MDSLMLILEIIILAMQGIFMLLIFRWEKRQASTYECDELYLDITKTLLSEPRLWDFYGIGTEAEMQEWQDQSEDDKRMYIFCEMNYFHFAFVYREFLQRRVSKAYWNIYQPWLKKLVRYSPIFMQVHEDCKDDFEIEFVRLVDGLQEQLSNGTQNTRAEHPVPIVG